MGSVRSEEVGRWGDGEVGSMRGVRGVGSKY